MKSWKTAAFTAAVLTAAGAGAALAPVAHGQSARATAPRAVQVFTFGSGRIGVSVSDLDADSSIKVPSGVLIDSVEEGSPAEKAGLKAGDVVLEFDGERVRSVRQFTRLVSETPAGRTVTAAIQRDGGRVTVNLTPAESGSFRGFEGEARRAIEDARAFAYTVPRALEREAPRALESLMWSGNQLGITTRELSPQLAEFFGTKDGLLVESVRDDSAAAKAGVKAGDVITAINGNTVESASELRRQLQRIDRAGEFSLSIVRDKKPMTVKGKVETPAPRRWTSRTIV